MDRVPVQKRDIHRQQRRERILDVAVRTLAHNGFERARMSDIAEAAGVAKGTLYNYFENKEHLLAAIFAERVLVPPLEALTCTEMSLRERLAALANDYFTEAVDKHPELVRLIMMEGPCFPDRAQLIYKQLVVPFAEAVAGYLDEQAALGRVRRRKDLFLTAHVFFGMLAIYVFTQEILRGKEVKPIGRQRWVEEAIDVFLHGVAREG